LFKGYSIFSKLCNDVAIKEAERQTYRQTETAIGRQADKQKNRQADIEIREKWQALITGQWLR